MDEQPRVVRRVPRHDGHLDPARLQPADAVQRERGPVAEKRRRPEREQRRGQPLASRRRRECVDVHAPVTPQQHAAPHEPLDPVAVVTDLTQLRGRDRAALPPHRGAQLLSGFVPVFPSNTLSIGWIA